MGRERDRPPETIIAGIRRIYTRKERQVLDAVASVRMNFGPSRPARSPCLDTQSSEESGRWIAIGHKSKFFLFSADVVAQVEVDVAFEIGHLVPEVRQFLLQGDPGITGKLVVVFRPGCLDRAAAVDAVGEVADGDGIRIRVVVFLQHGEIFGDKKGRAHGAAGKKQDAFSVFGKWLPVGTMQTELSPLGKGSAAFHVIESIWYNDFESPGQV